MIFVMIRLVYWFLLELELNQKSYSEILGNIYLQGPYLLIKRNSLPASSSPNGPNLGVVLSFCILRLTSEKVSNRSSPPLDFKACKKRTAKGEWLPRTPSETYSLLPLVRNFLVLVDSFLAIYSLLSISSNKLLDEASTGSKVPPKQTSIMRAMWSHWMLLILLRRRLWLI